ncbi:MAG: outer membrane protein assembly factor BamD [Balneolaceae bacterium]
MKKFIGIVTLFVIYSACSSSNMIRPGDTLDVAFEKARNMYEQEKYSDAASAFETVVSIGRGTDIGQEAQFLLAETYFKDRRYMLAAAEYERYALFYPNSPRREEIDFKTGKSYYELSPRYKLDQTNTYKAIERFRLFNSRYPSSERVQEAGEIITELRTKLARKKFEAANFYMRTNRYRSAVLYYDLVIDEFPETEWAERSLVDQIDAYIRYADNSVRSRQAERYRLAIDSYEKYIQLFPRQEGRSRAEELYDKAASALEKMGESINELATTSND